MAEPTQATDVTEAVRNCAECKKPIKMARRYYRNGAYYCNRNCHRKKMEKGKAERGTEVPASPTPAGAAVKANGKPVTGQAA